MLRVGRAHARRRSIAREPARRMCVPVLLGLCLAAAEAAAQLSGATAPPPPAALGVEAAEPARIHATRAGATTTAPRLPAPVRARAGAPKGVLTFTVNSTADTSDGVCDASSCTLRDALLEANGNPGADTIAFSIAGAGPHTIAVLTDLPTATEAVTIDGATEPDFAGTPVVVLDGAGTTGPQGWGISTSASNCTVRGLAIHGFANHSAIVLFGGSTNGRVAGNFVGTNAAGTVALGTGGGIDVATSHGNVIGGSDAADRNLVAGATLPAIIVREGSLDNVVRGNYVGLAADGTTALPNVGNDVAVFDSQRTLVEGNVVAGNSDASFPSVAVAGEVDLDPATVAIHNVIRGNLIGTDSTGNVALGSASVAVYIQDASNNTVGGLGSARNVIVGAGLGGVRILAPFGTAIGNLIRGNFIGVGADGTTPLGNTSNGVRLSHGTEGNSILDNVIANSERDGVLVRHDAGSGNRVSRNRLANNGLLGIDLTVDAADVEGSLTLNDVGDVDNGPNDLQNFPVLLATQPPNVVTGTLDSTPDSSYTIEIFRSPTCDPSGHGEGSRFVGSRQVQTDAAGHVDFAIPAGIVAGEQVTATAIDVVGSTSELSACLVSTVTDPCEVGSGLCLFAVTPCRVVDTRIAMQGSALLSGEERGLAFVDRCGIPPTARAVSVNVTVTQPTGAGFVTFYPEAGPPPQTSTINFAPGQTRANNAVLSLTALGDGTARARASVTGAGQVHLIIDVNGYFQ